MVKEPEESDKIDIIISVVFVVAFITVIVLITISGVSVAFIHKKQALKQKRNQELLTNTDGPLQFDNEDEKMFEHNTAAGCKRFVPTMIEKFEDMATNGSKLDNFKADDPQVTMID